MGKTKDLGHLAHIVAYNAENHITVPAGITMHTNQLVASQDWVTTALGSYALSSSLGSYVPTSRTITINGTTYDLSANRSWDITSMIYPAAGIPLSTGSAWGTSITNNSANWNTAYGWGNHASAGYLTSISSLDVVTALGYAPYNGTTNPNGYITGISFANVSAKPTTLSGYGITDAVPSARTITINGTTWDLSANRSFTVTASETDTLATVTARGASTASSITLSSNGNTFSGHHYFSAYDADGNHYPHYNTGSNANGSKLNLRVFSGSGGTTRVFNLNGQTGAISWDGNAIIHAGNIGSYAVTSLTDTLSTVTSRGASTNSVVDFGPDSGSNNGIGIRYGSGGYGRVRFYNDSINHSTIHSFGSSWDGGGIAKSQNCINVDGGGGVTIGAWNNPDMYVNKSGTIWAKLNLNTLQVNFRNSSNNAFLTGNGDWGLRLANDNGYIQFGPANSSWTHIYTDKNFYFNQNLYVNGTQVVTNSGTWSISISGNSATVGGISESRIVYGDGARASTSSSNMNDPNQKSGFHFYYDPSGRPYAEWWNWMTVAGNSWQSSNNYSFQFAHAFHNDDLYVRRMTNGSAAGWRYILTDANYNSYAPTKTGGGASGSWNIGITGAAGSLAYNASADNIYNSGWFRNYGDSGLYNQDYGCHFRRNAGSSHGAWEIFGYTKGGYVGLNIVDQSGYNNNLMYENGNGGVYTQNGNGWQWYYNIGSNCIGLGGSTTYNWVRAVVNGKLKIESDTIHTGWAYFDSNVQFTGGNTQYHQTNEYYNWRDWGGWGGYWMNRNGGDMIMNLYALYSVTGSISDIRYKKDVTSLTYGLTEIMQLNPIKYHYNLPKESMLANDPDYFLGFSAQEVQALIPEAVHEKVGEDIAPGMLAITYDELIPVLVNGIKEQQVMIHNQNIKINKLETLVNQLLNN